MIFVHGSKQNIVNSSFKVFDYKKDLEGNFSTPEIDNGIDQEGIGLNAWIGKSEETLKNAELYTSKDSAYIYVLKVDIEEEDLMHLRDADELSVEELVVAIDLFIERKRDLLCFSKEKIDNVMEYYSEKMGDFSLEDINFAFKANGVEFQLDKYNDPKNFDDFDDWRYSVDELYDISEPCSQITQEGGSEAIAEYAINSSDNLWETISKIGDTIAVEVTGKGVETYNALFQSAILDTFPDSCLVAAYSKDGGFAIIFGTNEIEVVEKIDLNAKNKLNNVLSVEEIIENKRSKSANDNPSKIKLN